MDVQAEGGVRIQVVLAPELGSRIRALAESERQPQSFRRQLFEPQVKSLLHLLLPLADQSFGADHPYVFKSARGTAVKKQFRLVKPSSGNIIFGITTCHRLPRCSIDPADSWEEDNLPPTSSTIILIAHPGTGDGAGRVPWVKETEIVWITQKQ